MLKEFFLLMGILVGWVGEWMIDFWGCIFFFLIVVFGVFLVGFVFLLLLWVCTHWMDDFSAFFLILTIEYSCHPLGLQRGKWIQIKSIKCGLCCSLNSNLFEVFLSSAPKFCIPDVCKIPFDFNGKVNDSLWWSFSINWIHPIKRLIRDFFNHSSPKIDS